MRYCVACTGTRGPYLAQCDVIRVTTQVYNYSKPVLLLLMIPLLCFNTLNSQQARQFVGAERETEESHDCLRRF